MGESGYDAIVLSGGSARRLDGIDKPALLVGGASLLQRAVTAVADAERIVVVGPPRPIERDVLWARESPPGGGPVAAVVAGLPHVRADVVLVLAADLPGIAPAVPVLRTALGRADVAVLVDATGRVNHLAAAWRQDALRAALATVADPHGAAMRTVVAAAGPVLVPDPDGWGRDCDTWADLAAARETHGR